MCSPIKDVPAEVRTFEKLPEDWQLIPTEDGSLHLVDINSQIEDIEASFNPWVDVNMLLFTQSNPTVGQRIDLNNAAQLFASNFNPNHQTRYGILICNEKYDIY